MSCCLHWLTGDNTQEILYYCLFVLIVDFLLHCKKQSVHDSRKHERQTSSIASLQFVCNVDKFERYAFVGSAG